MRSGWGGSRDGVLGGVGVVTSASAAVSQKLVSAAVFVTVESSWSYGDAVYHCLVTATTVGYGDWSASTFLEKIVCIFIMFIGVIAFSFASGALANYIEKQDEHNEVFAEKNAILDRLYKEHTFPIKLYSELKKNLRHNYLKDMKAVAEFVEDLPLNFRQ